MGTCTGDCNEGNCNPLSIERKRQEGNMKKQYQTNGDSSKPLVNTDETKTEAYNNNNNNDNEEDHESGSDFSIDEDDQDTVGEIKSTFSHDYKPNDNKPKPFRRKTSSKLDLPLTFEEIQEYVATNRTGEFKRDPKWDALYAEHRKNTKEKYKSIYDKIQVVEMEYPSKINQDGKIEVIREENDEKTVFADNLFPYFIEDDIKHDLVFSTYKDGLTAEQVNEFLKKEIDHDKYDVYWYENPPHMKSLPLLWHVQVFSRPKKTSTE